MNSTKLGQMLTGKVDARDSQVIELSTVERLEARVNRLAKLLDSEFLIPGTNWRIGLDGIIGLIPGFGDAAGAIASAFLIYLSARAGVPLSVLLRMFVNVLIDSIVGIIPIFGDIFDFAFKSNAMNARLLQKALAEKERVPRSDAEVARLFGVIILSVALFVPIATVACMVWIIRLLWH